MLCAKFDANLLMIIEVKLLAYFLWTRCNNESGTEK